MPANSFVRQLILHLHIYAFAHPHTCTLSIVNYQLPPSPSAAGKSTAKQAYDQADNKSGTHILD
jgi:hypothetical protein